MNPSLLPLAGLLLVLMALAAGMLVAQSRGATWARRLETSLGNGRPVRDTRGETLGGWGSNIAARPATRRVVALLGMRPDRIGEIRPRWFVVLGLVLLVARAAGGIAGDALDDWVVLPVTAALYVPLCRFAFGTLEARRRDALFRQFPDTLAQITRAVRVGIPVVESIRQVASEAPQPTATEFRAVSDRLALGVPLDVAVTDTAVRTGVPEYAFFATALSLQARTGGGLADTLENLADVIRKRVALRERGQALAAEAKTSAAILAALPFITCGMLFLVNPSYAAVLFTTPSGKTALALAAALLTTGLLSMRFIIKKSLS